MKSLLSIAGLLLCSGSIATAEDSLYEGAWHTTNRKLDGTMTCAVKELGDNKWSGRFYGQWQGTPFDYTVSFTGPPEKLQGKATIDGADYLWSGSFNSEDDRFKGQFGGNRYSGYFDLTKKPAVEAATGAKLGR